MASENRTQPAISVIVPVYRVEAYLETCVRSILSQTFSDFELLLVDDGSPDRCPKICEALCKEDDRIRVFHQENQGQSAARNNALRYAAGEWICFVDSDDALHPEMLRILYEESCASSARIVGCEAWRGLAFDDAKDCRLETTFERMTVDEACLEHLYRKDGSAYWCVWGKLIAKEIAVALPMTVGRSYEDNEIMCRWLHQAKTVSFTDAKLYFYRENPVSITGEPFNLRKTDYLWALQEQLRFYEALNYTKMADIIASRYLSDALWLYGLVQKYLDEPEKEQEILSEMRAVYTTYRHRLQLSNSRRRDIEELLLPVKRMWFRTIRRWNNLVGRILSRKDRKK